MTKKNTKKREAKQSNDLISIRARHFFLTVPHFEGTIAGVIEALKTIQPDWQYLKYAAVLESHTENTEKGNHLHFYICFPQKRRLRFNRFDYFGKHGKLESVKSYSAVLKYMTKENLPRSNFDYMKDIMKKDFPRAVEILLSQGLHIRDIYRKYSSIAASKNWSGYLNYLQYQKDSEKFLTQIKKPGLRMITPELIKARLNAHDYELFYTSNIYQRIVDKINDIVIFGCTRPHKAKALFLTGKPNTGKSSLGLALQARIGTFTFPDDGWWQGYQSDVFKLIVWDEFNLKRFTYPVLLKFLQGLRMDLPIKGSHVTRNDNPLILLTSNLPLEQHICSKFDSQKNRQYSRANLAVRIDEVDIGDNPIFFLEKLLVSPTQDI